MGWVFMTRTIGGEVMSDERCSLCDQELDADNHYGEDDFPLCRYHHQKFMQAIEIMASGGIVREPKQQSLFPEVE